MRNYLPDDKVQALCYLWNGMTYYQEPTEEYIAPKTTVRVQVGAVAIRRYQTLDDLFEQVEIVCRCSIRL